MAMNIPSPPKKIRTRLIVVTRNLELIEVKRLNIFPSSETPENLPVLFIV
jgi:hypothetical protein